MGLINERLTELRNRAVTAVEDGDDWAERCSVIRDGRTNDIYALSVYVDGSNTAYGVAHNFGDVEWFRTRRAAVARFFEMRRATSTSRAWERAS